ncbi:MAG: tRNA preQ1(34) S-adenosylmethionine ribosyltransferase-isomerase QueA [Desulfobacteraceae bacterium]|nr:tRNA preQ1(34) S-adenosylmethionine ribosyltransferase-isomerase QueA [Desulfobacteraceae bacterium]MBC2753375.1 tRNA preQ1(34) S-adenosylmethionine ribosyltransferase-isomerase QueA [Desulfobacteraceae bacterium]
MYSLDDYDYVLPEERIAQTPAPERDQARLMVMDRRSGAVRHHQFQDLPDLLTPRDLLVVNNTRVVPARLLGHKSTGGKVEVLILDYAGGLQRLSAEGVFTSACLIKASKKPKPGARLHFSDDLSAEIIGSRGDIHTLQFTSSHSFEATLERTGIVPLPPYIKRAAPAENPHDRHDYQTVYATEKGAVAAPTAGLHFTPQLLQDLEARGIPVVALTLHVGHGTFLPVRVTDIRDHAMHAERFTVTPTVAAAINRHKARGGRIVAVGTTSVRTLEYAAGQDGRLQAMDGQNDLYIYPGYRFRLVDAMITNFHLPQSTLLMLVSAFAGREAILAAYREAIQQRYRFFSYGDGMLIA